MPDVSPDEQEPLHVEWKASGARVYVSYRGARYHRDIPEYGFATHSEAGALLRVRRETVWRWVQAGKLKGKPLRGVQVVSLSELRKFGVLNGYLVRKR